MEDSQRHVPWSLAAKIIVQTRWILLAGPVILSLLLALDLISFLSDPEIYPIDKGDVGGERGAWDCHDWECGGGQFEPETSFVSARLIWISYALASIFFTFGGGPIVRRIAWVACAYSGIPVILVCLVMILYFSGVPPSPYLTFVENLDEVWPYWTATCLCLAGGLLLKGLIAKYRTG